MFSVNPLTQKKYLSYITEKIRLPERASVNSSRDQRLKEVCTQFEAIFLNLLFQQMRETIPESDFLQRGLAHKIYEDRLYTHLAEKMAEGGGIGLARMLYRQLREEDDLRRHGLNEIDKLKAGEISWKK